MPDLADLDLDRMLSRGAGWRIEKIAIEDIGERWAIVVYDEQRRRLGAYAHPRFTSEDATKQWFVKFFTYAIE